MILLAIDTSGKNGSVALASTARRDIEIIEVVPLEGGTFSAQLVPQIAALLQKHGYEKSDLEGFAVTSGPGSFTGLRVGLAAIKALAEILGKPIAAVSLLEAVARSLAAERVLAVLDAGRGEVYAGDYQLQPQVRMCREWLLTQEELVATARGRVVVTPDVALAERLRPADVSVEQVAYPRSNVIARLGWERIQRGETVSPEELEANYIRRSDAEIFSHPKV